MKKPSTYILALALALGVSSNALAQATLTGAGPLHPYVGIGDLGLSSVAAFYGLRCYSAAYSGNVADVWDAATGNTTETIITCSAGGVLNQTVNSLATTCASGCLVKEIYDQVGTRHLTQATNANRPTFATSGCGYSAGRAQPWCMQFAAGSSQRLTNASVTGFAQTWDFMSVAERTGNTSAINEIFAAGSGEWIGFRAVANYQSLYAGTQVNAAANDSVWHAFQGEGAGASGATQVDGTLLTSQNAGSAAASTSWAIGSAAGGGSSYLTGNVAEVVVTSAANLANWNTVSNNQHLYWGF